MEYVLPDELGYDMLYAGSFCGRVSAFVLAKRKVPRTLRPEDISRDLPHSGEVTCLMHRCGGEGRGVVWLSCSCYSPCHQNSLSL